MNFTNRHNLHLNPDPDGSGGGAAPVSAPAGGDAAPAAPEVPAFDPNAFKTEILGTLRSEFGSFGGKIRSELDSRLSRFQPQGGGEPDDKEPSLEDKKYLNAQGELDAKGFQQYQKDLYKHVSKSERAAWEKEHSEAQNRLRSESSFRTAQKEHLTREAEYEKANPSYRQDLIAAGDLEVNPKVGHRILASKYSANIIHHFAKNRGDFARFQALSYDDPESALEMIGELGYQFKSTESAQNRGLPSARPTKGAFGGGGAKPTQRSREEIVKDWRN